jgi:hypothetical protein
LLYTFHYRPQALSFYRLIPRSSVIVTSFSRLFLAAPMLIPLLDYLRHASSVFVILLDAFHTEIWFHLLLSFTARLPTPRVGFRMAATFRSSCYLAILLP